VIGLTEDVLTAEWATFDDEHVDDIETIAGRHFNRGRGRAGAVRLAKDALAKLRIFPRARERLLRAIGQSDYVVCCSEAQAASLRHLNPFCDSIAEAIPPSDFPLPTSASLSNLFAQSEGPTPIRLLWEGTEWGMQLLETLKQPLEMLALQTSTPFELVVAMPRIRSSPFFGEVDNQSILKSRFSTRTHFFPWQADTIGSLIRACDIGLAPMPQLNPFYRAKAFNKPAVYMSLGLPVVASAIPSYQQLVSHGQDGFIASTPTEWTMYLQKLIEQPALRRTMGAQAQAKIEYVHSVDAVAAAFLSVFQKASTVALSRT